MKITKQKTSLIWLILLQWLLAYEWLNAAWEKFAKPDFMNTIGQTMQVFAAKTTHHFYANFLNSANPTLMGELTRWGELLVGLGLLVGGLWVLTKGVRDKRVLWALFVALLGGALLNLNFYLAAGWSGPSTSGINVVMGWSEVILAAQYFFLLKSAK